MKVIITTGLTHREPKIEIAVAEWHALFPRVGDFLKLPRPDNGGEKHLFRVRTVILTPKFVKDGDAVGWVDEARIVVEPELL